MYRSPPLSMFMTSPPASPPGSLPVPVTFDRSKSADPATVYFAFVAASERSRSWSVIEVFILSSASVISVQHSSGS